MIQIEVAVSPRGSRRHILTMRLIARLLCALAVLALWAQGPARANVSAIPEFIPLTEQDLQTRAGAELASAQETFRASLGEDPARAIEVAKDIVRQTIEAYGESHGYVSRALTNLAIVQAGNADWDTAIENYNAAIRARERASASIVSEHLINPLRGLADAYMALNDVERAIPVLKRAIHISHVNGGPGNLDQVETLNALSRAYYFSGDFDALDDTQDAVFRLRERQAENNSDLYLDALDQRATWFVRTGNFLEAALFYRRVVRTLSERYGEDDLRLVVPLAKYARSANHNASDRFAFVESKRAIGQAVRIARENADENPEILPRTLVEQGDFFRALGLSRDSGNQYREAWDILDADPALHSTRDDLFASPVRVWRPPMRTTYRVPVTERADPMLYPQRGYVDAIFDVNEYGVPFNVRIVDASPAGLMDLHVRYRVGRFKFRPAFADGEPRAVTGLSYRHNFRYNASALTDRERDLIERTGYDAKADSGIAATGEQPASN